MSQNALGAEGATDTPEIVQTGPEAAPPRSMLSDASAGLFSPEYRRMVRSYNKAGVIYGLNFPAEISAEGFL